MHSLEWLIDSLLGEESFPSVKVHIGPKGLLGAECLVGGKRVAGVKESKIVLDEELSTISEDLVLCFLVPRDSVPTCVSVHLGSLDFCLGPVPEVRGWS